MFAGITASIPKPEPVILDPYWDNVVMLAGFEGADAATAIVDEGPQGRALTAYGNAQIDTGIALVGSSSLLLDGTGDYVRCAYGTGLTFVDGDFTLECLVRFPSTKSVNVLFSKRPTSNVSEFWVYINSMSELNMQIFGSATARLSLITNYAFNIEQTYHIAAVKSGNECYLFVDGVLNGQGTISGGAVATNTQDLYIGRSPDNTTRDARATMDEVRVTKAARYTANFTVPSFPLPRSKYA